MKRNRWATQEKITRYLSALLLAPVMLWVLNCTEARNIEDTLVQGNEFIVSTIPSNGFAAHSRDRAIVIGFTRDMDPATITAPGAIQVVDSTSAPVAGTVTYHNVAKAAVFMPAGLLASGELHTVTVDGTVTDMQGNVMGAPYAFTFTTFIQNSPKLAADTTVPSIIFRYPVDGSSGVTTTTGISITFDEPIHPGSIVPGTVTLTDGVNTVPTVVTYVVPGNTIMMFPEVLLRNNTMYTINIAGGITDTAITTPNVQQPVAPATTVASWSFTTELDQIPPEIYSTSPINGSNGVALDASISVTFSEEIDLATLNSVNFEVLNITKAVSVPGAYQFDVLSNTATFVPTAGTFDPSTKFQVTLGTGVADLSGNGLVSPVVFSFQSGTQLDTTPPDVVSTSPVDGSVNINLNANITVNFSEPMSPGTVNNSSVQLTITGTTNPLVPPAEIGALVGGNVLYNGANNSAVFMPATDLYANTTYTLNVLTTVADLAGKTMAIGRVISFTTGSQSDLTGPVVMTTTPVNGTTNVPAGTAITAVFDEELNVSTVTTSSVVLNDGTANIPGLVSHTMNGLNSQITFTPDPATPLVYGKIYTMTINTLIKDLAGNPMAADYRWSFSMEPPMPPAIAAVSPANGTTSVALGDPISVTFNREMDQTTISALTVSLDNGMMIVPSSINYAVDQTTDPLNPVGIITIIPDPASPLEAGLIYTATISGTVADINGIPLGAEYRWSFSVQASTGPQVASVTPLNGETNFTATGIISAVVGGQVDPATIINANFTLTDGTTNYQGLLSSLYDAATDKTTLVFTPDVAINPLVEGSLYVATLTTGIADPAGNNMLHDYSWSFYIPSQTTNPMISSVTPAADATNVLVSSPISVSFSAPLDANTIANLANYITVEYIPLGDPQLLLKIANKNIASGVNSLGWQVKPVLIYDYLTDTVLIDPGKMAQYSLYTVKIKSGITDINGSVSAVDSSWSFTTELNYRILVSTYGLTSPNSLVVRNNIDASTLILYGGTFAQYMPNSYPLGTAYDVVIDAAASNLKSPVQNCSISAAKDMILTNGYVLIQVNCYTLPFTIGGSIGGINGSWVTLGLNGMMPEGFSADGSFQLSTPLPDQSLYTVSILDKDPAYECQILNASGQITGANVTNVYVTCWPAMQYFVQVDVVGLPSGETMVLDLNGGESIFAMSDGRYQFTQPLYAGDSYYVGIPQQPPSATCTSSVRAAIILMNGSPQPLITVTCTSNNQTPGVVTSFLEGTRSYYVDVEVVNSLLYTLGSMTTTTGQQCMVVHRLMNNGTAFVKDPSYDPTGAGTYRFEFCPPGGESIEPIAMAADRQGNLILTGNNRSMVSSTSYPFFFKITPQGAVISNFSVGLSFAYPIIASLQLNDIMVQSNDNILLIGKMDDGSGILRPVVIRTGKDGLMDTTFGTGGYIYVPNPNPIYTDITPVEITEDFYTGTGLIMVMNAINPGGLHDTLIYGLNGNGQTNTSFGVNGSGFAVIADSRARGIFLDGGAGFVVTGWTHLASDPAGAYGSGFAGKFTYWGAPQVTFGGGVSIYTGCLLEDMVYSPDGHFIASANCYNNPAVMSINAVDGTMIPWYGVNGRYTYLKPAGVYAQVGRMTYYGADVVTVGITGDLTTPQQMFIWAVPSF